MPPSPVARKSDHLGNPRKKDTPQPKIRKRKAKARRKQGGRSNGKMVGWMVGMKERKGRMPGFNTRIRYIIHFSGEWVLAGEPREIGGKRSGVEMVIFGNGWNR